MGIETKEIAAEEMASFYKLEKNTKYKNPFNRIIIWHCIQHNETLISLDGKFDAYVEFGLKVLR